MELFVTIETQTAFPTQSQFLRGEALQRHWWWGFRWGWKQWGHDCRQGRQRWRGERGWTCAAQGTCLKELLLLKPSQACRLHQSKRLVCLDFPANLQSQPRYKATQKEQCRQADNTIRKIFEFRKVRSDYWTLGKLAKGTSGILVLWQGKSCLQCLKEYWPGWELTVRQEASDILRRGVELRYSKLLPQVIIYFTFYSSYNFP